MIGKTKFRDYAACGVWIPEAIVDSFVAFMRNGLWGKIWDLETEMQQGLGHLMMNNIR